MEGYEVGAVAIDPEIMSMDEEVLGKIMDDVVRWSHTLFDAEGEDGVKTVIEEAIVALYKYGVSEEQAVYLLCDVVPRVTGEITTIKTRAAVKHLSVKLIEEYKDRKVH